MPHYGEQALRKGLDNSKKIDHQTNSELVPASFGRKKRIVVN